MSSGKEGADLLIERLSAWGVDTIFGFPGDRINGIFEALRTHQETMRFIQVRHEEVLRLAETVAGPIVKPLLGKAVVPDTSPFTTGGIGLLGTAPSQDALSECDTLIMLGTSFPNMEFLPKPGQARIVQVDVDPTRIGLRQPVHAGLVGDCRAVLAALLPLLQPKEDRAFLKKAQQRMKDWNELIWHHRLRVPCARRGTQAGRLARPRLQRDHGATGLCASALRTQRLPWPAGQPAAKGRLMHKDHARNRGGDSQARAQFDASPGVVERLPIDPITGSPLPPLAQPGYYPGFSTLSQQSFWDEATRAVVLARLRSVPPIRFFSPEEAALMRAVLDRILPQDDRDQEHRIPILPALDARLQAGHIDGYRYEDMPPDGEAHRLGLQAIEAIARQVHGRWFVDLGPRDQDAVLQTIHDGEPPAAEEIWRRMPVKRYWAMLLQDAVDVYYAHPYAWDEIGFGGPAYPRGYLRQEGRRPEPWEADEQRYAWAPPPTALSAGRMPARHAPAHPGESQTGSGEGGVQ